jgi:hypothetical protein
LVEHTAENRGVAGSIPALATFIISAAVQFAAATDKAGAANNGARSERREPAKPVRCQSERKAKRSKREKGGKERTSGPVLPRRERPCG